jgi:hypothetical protein
MRPVARLVVASVAANILLIVLIGLMIPTIGEFIESEFFPHSGPRTIVEKRRGTERFCWEQEFTKWRTGTARIWNYHLSDDHVPPNVESFTPWRAVGTTGFDNPDGLQTGDPQKSNEETPLGLNRTSFCMDLPTWVQPGGSASTALSCSAARCGWSTSTCRRSSAKGHPHARTDSARLCARLRDLRRGELAALSTGTLGLAGVCVFHRLAAAGARHSVATCSDPFPPADRVTSATSLDLAAVPSGSAAFFGVSCKGVYNSRWVQCCDRGPPGFSQPDWQTKPASTQRVGATPTRAKAR